MTECTEEQIEFQGLGRRQVVGNFDGGKITSDAGALLLREVEHHSRLLQRFAGCFRDYRDPERIEPTVEELVFQRIYAIALGYEDLNDHEELRKDLMLATLVEKKDLLGEDRVRLQDRGIPLAGKSTLNRLELTAADASKESRYQKIVYESDKIDELLVDHFLNVHPRVPKKIILDVDATDDPIYGKQEGRFFHGYYREYCYLPLYIFCGDLLLCARLRSSDVDPAQGVTKELDRLVSKIRKHWPSVKILVRGDGGFCREEIMAWCESHHVDYLFGLAKNPRLLRHLKRSVKKARKMYGKTKKAARVFKEFRYATLKTWSKKRRVIGKAEYLAKGENPRFIVTSVAQEKIQAQALYENVYCARGEMENRIKEQQLGLFADRTSTHTMRANQLRLWFSSIAYLLMNELPRVGLKGTQFAKTQCSTIRNKLLKIGAWIGISVRRIHIRMASGYPYASLFRKIVQNIQVAYPGKT